MIFGRQIVSKVLDDLITFGKILLIFDRIISLFRLRLCSKATLWTKYLENRLS